MDRDRERGRGGGRPGPSPGQLLDKVRQLRAKISQDVYDLTGWDQAWEELKSLQLSDETRAIYEELVAAFPTKADVWCKYSELELAAGNLPGLKAIFQRCLMAVPSLELWALYMKFIRRSNKSKGADGVVEIRNALEFTLERAGQDINSGPFWQDLLQLLQSAKAGTPEFGALFPQAMVGQEDNARMAAVRRVYQQAVTIPHHHLDGLWRDYQRFENDGPNKQFAKKVLDEWSPKYQAAKAVYRERRKRAAVLSYALWPLPSGKGGLLQDQQAQLWREYLAYERTNPQGLDPPVLLSRVSLAFDQALICFLYFPDFWLEYAEWHTSCGRPDAAGSALTKGQAALPQCLQLRMLAADLAERTGSPEQAVAIYEGLALNLEQQQAVTRGSLPAAEGELVWVQYMQLLRRVEGDFHSRKLFLRARKWHLGLPAGEHGCWRLYADAALLEWRRGRDAAAARNIFEKGLEDTRIFREPQYAIAYLDLLCGLGDLDNARALLARVLGDETNAKCVTLWQRYIAFEGMSGDLAAVVEVERQAMAALRGEEAEQLKSALPLIRCHGDGSGAVGGGGGSGPPGSNIRPPSAYTYSGAAAAGQEPQPLKQLPPQLGLFINSLPPPQAVEGIVPDVDQVIEALLTMDLTAGTVLQVCLDLESGKTLAHMGQPQQGGPPPDQPPYPHGHPHMQQEPPGPHFGRPEPGGPPYGGPPGPYGYGQGSPGPGPRGGGGGGGGYSEPYGDGPPGGPDEYGKRRYQYGYDPNEGGEDDGYDNGYGGGRDLYHQRLRRRMDQ
ncbi:hypothetical protein VOLCADRAFT_116706 [Volvox carteri f. nagariensis]|uniref:Suppressor of forked domain-containing protein n=1 Tax=Volvox carteri f. nagariensis TaxID=3068 RepID=D8TP08_VOLCA|nr:uncharacterized protein VOLCADRAFT_116706 [Volvox carteri f. nagariensis]EFJ50539.1 hypothetical protein VOLCADRAFT_116706 [Volvox carteri f. nagariensis]|eukprot:XP_002948132.1 hypothetical protein VOLCADRAFT_116706 [Volvox carteri f. nagariensis]